MMTITYKLLAAYKNVRLLDCILSITNNSHTHSHQRKNTRIVLVDGRTNSDVHPELLICLLCYEDFLTESFTFA